ncbi:UvrD-helicase domain-containing protein [Sediminitomix flava]|uniref:DNA 3'-5' helicase n=1 Tax=Sediminitomix flava TaxID=379075 RepID=A0A315Z8V3_SEDFL|nr:UvrD-helicase domain-containing protein [Sediminitomix flava]PWJ41995.1 ATP-dependent exoDNAse (exonuclease V) beta subunit [Sediminitomix flava]
MDKQFKVYSSSAGSGKTFTLTKEYLKIVFTAPALEGEFRSDYFKSILAVTFTRDATNEMKDRILDSLSDMRDYLNGGEKPFILKLIVDELNEEYPQSGYTEKIISERAESIYYSILHNYSDFAVSTIDSFNQKIVQAFKKDLELPFRFDLQLDKDELLQDAIQIIQDKAGKKEQSKLTQLLVDFAFRRASEGNSWYLDHSLTSFGQNIFSEEKWNIIQNLSELTLEDFERLRKEIIAFNTKIENQVRELAQKGAELIKTNQIEAADFAYGNSTIHPYFNKLANPDVSILDVEVKARLSKLFNDNSSKWHSSKASSAAQQAIELIRPQLVDLHLQINSILQDVESDYIIAKELDKNIYLLSSINEISNEINRLKEEKNIVHISDINKKINTVIEGQPVPYLYERIGEKYNHILIDEFQDTSMMQWHNLIPLVTHTLSKNLTSLVVGDPKQAIYRWRGGKAQMLVSLPEITTAPEGSSLKDEEYTFKMHQESIALQTNYRSRSNVITFNNHFFNLIVSKLKSDYPSITQYYQDVAQNITSKAGGNVSIQLLNDKQQYADTSLYTVLNTINNVIDKGYRYSDIAILVRNNSHGVNVAQFLIEKGLRVVSSESLLVNNSEAVQLSICLLKIISSKDIEAEKLHLYRILSKLTKKSNLLQGKKYLDFTLNVQNSDLPTFFKHIKDEFNINIDYNALNLLPLYDLIEEIYNIFNFNNLEDQQIYLQRFLDIILDFSNIKGNHLLDFLTFWETKSDKLSINSPQSEDSIEILTIHKSKGLQYPIVIMPFADWKTTPYPTEKLWLEWENNLFPDLNTTIMGINKTTEKTLFSGDVYKEKEATFLDAFNVLYVAMTRAEEELHIIGKETKSGNSIQHISHLFNLFLNQENEDLHIDKKEIEITLDDENEPILISEYSFFDDVEEKVDSKKKEEIENYNLPKVIHSSSKSIISLKSNNNEEFESELSISELLSTQRKGLLVHKAFEKLNTINDLDKVLEELKYSGAITSNEIHSIKEQMLKVMDLEELKEYFLEGRNYKVLNERELILRPKRIKGLSTVKSLRPDRVLVKDKKVIIIDYKTGNNPQESHIQQIKKYGEYFQSLGYKEIEKILVYTEVPFCKIVT